MKKCENCNKEYEQGSFCPECGAKLIEEKVNQLDALEKIESKLKQKPKEEIVTETKLEMESNVTKEIEEEVKPTSSTEKIQWLYIVALVNLIVGALYLTSLVSNGLFLTSLFHPALSFAYLVLSPTVCIATGIYLIKAKKVAHGVCIMIFGGLTFGIWPFVINYKGYEFIQEEN